MAGIILYMFQFPSINKTDLKSMINKKIELHFCIHMVENGIKNILDKFNE